MPSRVTQVLRFRDTVRNLYCLSKVRSNGETFSSQQFGHYSPLRRNRFVYSLEIRSRRVLVCHPTKPFPNEGLFHQRICSIFILLFLCFLTLQPFYEFFTFHLYYTFLSFPLVYKQLPGLEVSNNLRMTFQLWFLHS